MKTKLTLLIAIVFLSILSSCKKEAQSSTTSGNFKVEFLFEIDGCKVYRFYDGGYAKYFTTREGSVISTEKHGRSTVNSTIETIEK